MSNIHAELWYETSELTDNFEVRTELSLQQTWKNSSSSFYLLGYHVDIFILCYFSYFNDTRTVEVSLTTFDSQTQPQNWLEIWNYRLILYIGESGVMPDRGQCRTTLL